MRRLPAPASVLRRLAGPAAALSVGLAATPAPAQDLPACPDRVAVAETWQGATPAEWEVVQRPTEHVIADIRFHAGPPATAPIIEPVAGSSTGQVLSARYALPAVGGEVWMACIYADTAFTLVRKLPGPFPPHVRVNHDRRARRVYISYF